MVAISIRLGVAPLAISVGDVFMIETDFRSFLYAHGWMVGAVWMQRGYTPVCDRWPAVVAGGIERL